MSCHLCLAQLEFGEIAGFNPNLPAESSERTNFCWEDEAHTVAAPICDECYYASDRSAEESADIEEEVEDTQEEEEPLPIYSFCRICNNIIQEISPIGLTDEELEIEMFTHLCDDCIDNPVTPIQRASTSPENGSPSAEQEHSQSPSSYRSWSQP